MKTIDPFIDKAHTISLIDFNNTFISLISVFEQRKEAARIYSIDKDPQVKEVIKYYDKLIIESFVLEDINEKI
jgi:hypothetical protein